MCVWVCVHGCVRACVCIGTLELLVAKHFPWNHSDDSAEIYGDVIGHFISITKYVLEELHMYLRNCTYVLRYFTFF